MTYPLCERLNFVKVAVGVVVIWLTATLDLLRLYVVHCFKSQVSVFLFPLSFIVTLHNHNFTRSHALTARSVSQQQLCPPQHLQTKLPRWFCSALFPNFCSWSIFGRKSNLPSSDAKRLQFHSCIFHSSFVPKAAVCVFPQRPPVGQLGLPFQSRISTHVVGTLIIFLQSSLWFPEQCSVFYFWLIAFSHWTFVCFWPQKSLLSEKISKFPNVGC